jgi:hypothetical protein
LPLLPGLLMSARLAQGIEIAAPEQVSGLFFASALMPSVVGHNALPSLLPRQHLSEARDDITHVEARDGCRGCAARATAERHELDNRKIFYSFYFGSFPKANGRLCRNYLWFDLPSL